MSVAGLLIRRSLVRVQVGEPETSTGQTRNRLTRFLSQPTGVHVASKFTARRSTACGAGSRSGFWRADSDARPTLSLYLADPWRAKCHRSQVLNISYSGLKGYVAGRAPDDAAFPRGLETARIRQNARLP